MRGPKGRHSTWWLPPPLIFLGICQSKPQTEVTTPWFSTRRYKCLCVMVNTVPEESSIWLIFLATVALGWYLRESVFCECNWGWILTYMGHFTAPLRESYSHFLDKFYPVASPSGRLLLPSAASVQFVLESVFMTLSSKEEVKMSL